MSGWLCLIPELIIVTLVLMVIVADLVVKKQHKHLLTVIALIGIAITIVAVWLLPEGKFGQAFIVDNLSRLLKTVVLASLGLVLMMAKDFETIWKRPQGELLTLVITSALGMMSLISSQELILMVVSLELTTFPLILLTAYLPHNQASAEGGIKYLLLAALGSAVLLFGISLIIAVTGVTTLTGIAQVVSDQNQHPLLLAGLIFIIAGVAFKVALVPFHMWAPDAYEGAPTPITAFLSVAGKTAGFAMAIRLFVTAFSDMRQDWIMIFAILSAASMLLGNFAAIPQRNIKRMLAYSSIAQAGYILMGLVAFNINGLAALIYYLIAYLVTTMAAFSVVIAVEQGSGRTDINAFRGLAQRSPKLALLMILALLSLAGIPPLAGFTAKIYLFTAAYGQGFIWLVILAVLNTALSLYYYLKVIRLMYIEKPEAENPAVLIKPHWGLVTTMIITVIGILLIGIIPNPFVTLAREAVAALGVPNF